MRKNTMKVSREQLGILEHLDKESVRYMAVGDFAMLAIDPARMLQQAQLWVEPARQNLQRLNRALKNMFGPRTTRQVNTTAEPDDIKASRQFSVGVGPFRVGIYFGVSGFKAGNFSEVYERSQAERVTVPGQNDSDLIVRRMSNTDLSHQMRTESVGHAEWNLKTIQNADKQGFSSNQTAETHKGQNVPYAPPVDEKPKTDEFKRSKVSADSEPLDHKGQNVLYDPKPIIEPLPVLRNLDLMRQKVDVEAVLSHYGFKPEATPKANDPWRIYERDGDGKPQRIVVGMLKESGQKHFYEVGNRSFQGDILDLVAGFEKPLVRANETLQQRVFGVTDKLLTQPPSQELRQPLPELKPLSSAYFFGTAATVREKAILSHYDIVPLTTTEGLEKLSLSKATVYAPEFDGRIKNISNGDRSASISPQATIAFPLYDKTGKIVDIATPGLKVPERYVRQQNSGDTADELWQSNQFYQTRTDIPVMGNQPIPAGTVGIIHRNDAQQLTFHNRQDNQDRRVLLPLQEAKALLTEQSATRLVIGQSPVDVLAVKQLNPEVLEERRLYVATAGVPTTEQIARIGQLLSRNPQAQLVLTTNQDAESHRTVINYLGLTHPAANPAISVLPQITPIYSADVQRASERDIGTFFYPKEPALRTSEDLLKRFGYHTYSQPSNEPGQTVGVDANHLERLMLGKGGITTGTDKPSSYSDTLTLNALASALVYAELHRIPLSDQLKAVRETPTMKAMIGEEKHDMRRVYDQEHSGKNRLFIELRQPANQPLAEKMNDQFLNRFINTLTMTSNQMLAKTHPQLALDIAFQPDRPIKEMSRQTFLDTQDGQVVTRSSISLPNEVRVLNKATQLLVNEINERQGQRLIQIIQPGPHHKTMPDMLMARNGQPLPPTHKGSIGLQETVKIQAEQTTGGELKSKITHHSPVERLMQSVQPVERVRPTVKVG